MIEHLESQLNDFDLAKRTSALNKLLGFAQVNSSLLSKTKQLVNMHCHSFYSFNSYGYSPSALVWLAKKNGLIAVGLVDFDNLDGAEEFIRACDRAEIRGSTAIETRIYIQQLKEFETNSPGEPGVSYATGVGFSSNDFNDEGSAVLQSMRDRAYNRNRNMVDVLNDYLYPVSIDYDQDVMPLTPSGNATERHMLVAYLKAANLMFSDPTPFWAEKLDYDVISIHEYIKDKAVFSNIVRRKLMKQGGIGYIKPSPDAFPTPEEFYRMVISNNAIPTYNYLNGTTNGEKEIQSVLDILVPKGVGAFNIIPDLAIPGHKVSPDNTTEREYRLSLLRRTIEIVKEFDLPLHIGSEMNSYGQRKFDDLSTPELEPFREDFINGAFFICGHVKLQRQLGIGYQSKWADSFFSSRKEKNIFYTKAGKRIPPGEQGITTLVELGKDVAPEDILSAFPEK